VVYGQLYSDQFYESGSGQVTYADGTAVYVPATFNSKQLTVSQGTPGAVPLTVNLLSTPSSQYYASPQSVTGRILATSNGGRVLLSSPDPVHGSILTGQTNLPISNYQLNPALSGLTPAGVIDVANAGDATYGYPVYSANLTGLYTFPSGWIKGFRIGGSVRADWEFRSFYYYPAGYPNSGRSLFLRPPEALLDLITGYSRKFGRVTWSTQLNVANLFNHYRVVIFPAPTSGWTDPSSLHANFEGQPRSYTWTNTLKF
jgi:hypothetical protein